MVQRNHGPIVNSWAGEIAFVDFFQAIVMQVGHQSCHKLELFPYFLCRQSLAIMEHIVMGIDDDDLYSIDAHLTHVYPIKI